MRFRYKSEYQKQFLRLMPNVKELAIKADKQIRDYYNTHTASYGLRIKKLYDNGRDKVYEARVSDKIRILWMESGDLVSFAMLGSHDDIRNALRHL